MPEVPAPEECELLQEYYRKRLERQTDDHAKQHFTGEIRVGILLTCT